MSKLIKGIGKAVKGIFKGVKKVFKKLTSSTFGKVLLGAAAIWLGGAAFGMWNTPFASVNGAFVGGSQTAAAQTVAGEAVAGTAAEAGTAGIAATDTVAAASGLEAGVSGTAAAVGGEASTLATAASEITPGLITGSEATGSAALMDAGGGLVKAGADGLAVDLGAGASKGAMALDKVAGGAGKVAGFAAEHPIATIMGMNAISGAVSDDESDLLKQRQENIYKAFNGLGDDPSIGVSPSGEQLKRPSTGAPVYEGGILASLRSRSRIFDKDGG